LCSSELVTFNRSAVCEERPTNSIRIAIAMSPLLALWGQDRGTLHYTEKGD
jgi:hypothetical protein